ncbi:MAG: efflux RND transporter periplasmic adaptor subunit [Candidatus Omnitrophota bacterium]
MMKIVKNIVLATVSLAVLFLMLMWMQGSFTKGRIGPGLLEDRQEEAKDASTVAATYIMADQSAEAVGSIQSRSTTNIASKILAAIETVAVRPGSQAKKGDLLITLDDRDLRARLQQTRNAVEAAQAVLDKAKKDRQRFESLLKTQSITQNTLDDAANAEQIAAARLEQANQQVREADVMLSNAKIFAPIDGTITEKYCDPGDIATPGKTLLTMYDPSNLRVEVAVREQLSGRLKIGDSAPVVIDAISQEMTGTVEEIVPSANPASRSVVVKVSIPREGGIYPGMYGRIRIPLDPVKCLVIPADAVRKVGQLEIVTMKKEGVLTTRSIRTGMKFDKNVEILSGLSEGDEIVVPSRKA